MKYCSTCKYFENCTGLDVIEASYCAPQTMKLEACEKYDKDNEQ